MKLISDFAEDEIVFYDLESTSVYAPYCEITLLAYQVGIHGKPKLVDLDSKRQKTEFAKLVGSEMYKVSYNGINFDDILLWRNGLWVNPKSRHDMYLALKTVHPTFPSYNLKFVNWMLDMGQSDDAAFHLPERLLERWLAHRFLDKTYMHEVPTKLFGAYCRHDVRETCNVFRALWEVVQQEDHWEPYTKLELAMGEPLHEMILLGREYIDLDDIRKKIDEKEREVALWNGKVNRWTNGAIDNAGSTKQITSFLSKHGQKLDETENGNLQLTKLENVQEIQQGTKEAGKLYDLNKLEGYKITLRVRIAYHEAHSATKMLGYLRSFYNAGQFERNGTISQREISGIHSVDSSISFEPGRNNNRCDAQKTNSSSIVSIPKSYYLSGARTRRFQSGSQFGINFQNQNKESKIIQLVPTGWIGFYIDSTQIENVTHIWASKDQERREAYEADPEWNEYVWLSNKILGEELDRKKLDKITSEVNPSWSVYKQYKTIKLAMNFGMGPDKFAVTTGLELANAKRAFEEVHRACPAIRKLQKMVRKKLETEGIIKDPFGHIYSGELDEVYKVVAYLIQGCGTGSIPKAMTVANFRTLHTMDNSCPTYRPYVYHPYKKLYSFGVLTGTTHDECAGRISLGIPTHRIIMLLKDLLYNMEGKFSSKFDGIPLRAKLSVSITNASEAEEMNHHASDFESNLTAMIAKGKQRHESFKDEKRKQPAGITGS